MTRALFPILALSALLSGCASVENYQPYITDATTPADQAQLAKDRIDCLARAKGYVAPTDIPSFGTAAAVGAGNNMAGAAINPLVPALGAIGGIGVAAMKAIGLNGADQVRVYLRCLEHRGLRSGAYDMLDPNL